MVRNSIRLFSIQFQIKTEKLLPTIEDDGMLLRRTPHLEDVSVFFKIMPRKARFQAFENKHLFTDARATTLHAKL